MCCYKILQHVLDLPNWVLNIVNHTSTLLARVLMSVNVLLGKRLLEPALRHNSRLLAARSSLGVLILDWPILLTALWRGRGAGCCTWFQVAEMISTKGLKAHKSAGISG